jgi:heptosyltransferase-2
MSEKPTAIVIRLTALGDILLTANLVQELACTYHVVFVTSPAYVSLVAQMSGVAEVKALSKNLGRLGLKELGAELSDFHPEVVLDLQHKPRTMMFARMIKSRRRMSLTKRTFLQGIQSLLGRDTILDSTHQSQRYLAVLPKASPSLASTPAFFKNIPDTWHSAGAQFVEDGTEDAQKPCVGFAFAATHVTKGWPADHIADTIQSLSADVRWILIGGPTDVSQLEILRAAGVPAAIPHSCEASLETLTGIIAHLDVLVGVDTGPVHLARLLNVKTLSLFGPTSIKRWGPGGFDENMHQALSLNLECQPCSNHGGPACPLSHHKCMHEMTPDSVVNKLSEMLELKR